MKILLYIMTFLVSMALTNAQEKQTTVEKGDLIIMGSPSADGYQHIKFPKNNILIKRGAVLNFKNLIGKELLIEEVESITEGSTAIILKRKDGLKFFRFYPTVSAHLEKALAKKELLLPITKDKDLIAQQ